MASYVVPGFTGHLPGYLSENLHGHSFGYLTHRRSNMVSQQEPIPNSTYGQDFTGGSGDESKTKREYLVSRAGSGLGLATMTPLSSRRPRTAHMASPRLMGPNGRPMTAFVGASGSAMGAETYGTQSVLIGVTNANAHRMEGAVARPAGTPRVGPSLQESSRKVATGPAPFQSDDRRSAMFWPGLRSNPPPSATPINQDEEDEEEGDNEDDVGIASDDTIPKPSTAPNQRISPARLRLTLRTPSRGYSGFVPAAKDADAGVRYRDGVRQARVLHRIAGGKFGAPTHEHKDSPKQIKEAINTFRALDKEELRRLNTQRAMEMKHTREIVKNRTASAINIADNTNFWASGAAYATTYRRGFS